MRAGRYYIPFLDLFSKLLLRTNHLRAHLILEYVSFKYFSNRKRLRTETRPFIFEHALVICVGTHRCTLTKRRQNVLSDRVRVHATYKRIYIFKHDYNMRHDQSKWALDSARVYVVT